MGEGVGGKISFKLSHFLKSGGGGGDRKTTQNFWVEHRGQNFLAPFLMRLLPTHYFGKYFENL